MKAPLLVVMGVVVLVAGSQDPCRWGALRYRTRLPAGGQSGAFWGRLAAAQVSRLVARSVCAAA